MDGDDLSDPLARFTEALAIIRIVARALDANERGTEASALHSGLAALDQVYAELDRLPCPGERRRAIRS